MAEVALGVQFRQLYGLRAIDLAPLRAQWQDEYPIVQEQAPLPPTIEGPMPSTTAVQFLLGPQQMSRLWFVAKDGSLLVQVQPDRFVVNWRGLGTEAIYPRYPNVREVLVRRWSELARFVTNQGIGTLDITQAELNYINVIDLQAGQLGHLEMVLTNWRDNPLHHLGAAQEVRLGMVFDIGDIGRQPVRMYVGTEPALRPDGTRTLFLTITVRGAPAKATFDSALEFIDGAHDHLVRSFAELTTDSMHTKWDRKR